MKAFHFFLMMVCLSITHLTAQSIVWDKTYGGDSGDGASSIVSTPDGGYLLGGTSNSGIGYEKSQPYKHLSDYWVIKVDAQGNEQWDQSFSGAEGPAYTESGDALRVVLPVSDGGYLLGGFSTSGMGFEKSEDNRGHYNDYWIVRLDANGNQLWDKTIGGPAPDQLYDIVETDDGGFLLAGFSFGLDLGSGFEKTAEAINYSEDYWIVKIDANTLQLLSPLQGQRNWSLLRE